MSARGSHADYAYSFVEDYPHNSKKKKNVEENVEKPLLHNLLYLMQMN